MKNYFLLLVGLLFLISHGQGWADNFTDIPKLSVKGEASIFKPADQMEATLGVVTTAENSSQAVKDNNQRIQQVIANLQALGLNETDYQTGHFAVHPIYTKPSKDSQQNESNKISHYEVVNAVKVKTPKIDLADKIIGAAIQGRANQIDQVNFNLANPQAYREGAIQAAAQNAIADANSLAKAMGVKLKRVLNIALDQWQQFPGPLMFNKRADIINDEAVGQNVFEPGQAEIHATVNVTFEIAQ